MYQPLKLQNLGRSLTKPAVEPKGGKKIQNEGSLSHLGGLHPAKTRTAIALGPTEKEHFFSSCGQGRRSYRGGTERAGRRGSGYRRQESLRRGTWVALGVAVKILSSLTSCLYPLGREAHQPGMQSFQWILRRSSKVLRVDSDAAAQRLSRKLFPHKASCD